MQSKEDLKHCISVAMGEKPADLLLVGGKVVSTFSEEIIETSVAVSRGRIVALDHVEKADEVVDLEGAYLCPSFIDAHIHVESSMLSPEGFAEIAVPRATGTVISDPHEIANVFGIAGIEYMQKAAQNLPLDIRYSIPSCVPATRMETAGGNLGSEEIEKIYQLNPSTPGLSELMNYPGVYFQDEEVLDKVMMARSLGLQIDGHSPMLRGKELNAYLNANIATDHECTTPEEAWDKLRRGMYILMREGSAARNLKDLLPILNDGTAHRICIASDDRHPDQIIEHGYLDRIWRQLIRWGVEPIRALRLMTLNPATAYNLRDRGGLGVGYRADFFTTLDLNKPIVESVYFQGKKVAEKEQMVVSLPRYDTSKVLSSVRLPEDLEEKLQAYPQSGKARVIGVLPGQLVTENLSEEILGLENDLCYLAVVERHGKNGQVGLGFVKGLGLKEGALGSTVAHDHHNLILVGKSISDMVVAAKTIQEMGGGFIAIHEGKTLSSLALPIAGLMSPEKGTFIAKKIAHLDQATKKLGISIESPFMVLSFLALSVIPHLKLTDMGLVDVDRFSLVPLKVENDHPGGI